MSKTYSISASKTSLLAITLGIYEQSCERDQQGILGIKPATSEARYSPNYVKPIKEIMKRELLYREDSNATKYSPRPIINILKRSEGLEHDASFWRTWVPETSESEAGDHLYHSHPQMAQIRLQSELPMQSQLSWRTNNIQMYSSEHQSGLKTSWACQRIHNERWVFTASIEARQSCWRLRLNSVCAWSTPSSSISRTILVCAGK